MGALSNLRLPRVKGNLKDDRGCARRPIIGLFSSAVTMIMFIDAEQSSIARNTVMVMDDRVAIAEI